MAAIKKKNVLNLGSVQRRSWWNDIRSKPELALRFKAGDLINVIPGVPDQVGGIVSTFLRFSVGVHGLVVFLIGDDPGPV